MVCVFAEYYYLCECACGFSPSGQDGTLQSFSIVHERFNKSLGHGETFGHFAHQWNMKKVTIWDW